MNYVQSDFLMEILMTLKRYIGYVVSIWSEKEKIVENFEKIIEWFK